MRTRNTVARWAAALLATAALGVVVPAAPAGAHHFDGNSQHTCYVERAPGWVIRHSHPTSFTAEYVNYRCCQWDGAREQRFSATLWWNGATTRHSDGPILIGDCF